MFQLAISLGVGYSINGEYKSAIDLMKNIKLEGLDYRKKALYYNNLACLYCEIGNVEAANLYLAKIYLKTNRIEKAKIILDYTLLQKLYPETLRKTLKVVEEMECQIGKSSSEVQ